MASIVVAGRTVLVCECHIDIVMAHTWTFEGRYILTRFSVKEGGKQAYMHRLINNTPKGFHTGHINRDKLDNRCINLRSVTPRENSLNRGLQSNNTSGFIGVTKNKNGWRSYTKRNGQQIIFGTFPTKELAAEAREKGMLCLGV